MTAEVQSEDDPDSQSVDRLESLNQKLLRTLRSSKSATERTKIPTLNRWDGPNLSGHPLNGQHHRIGAGGGDQEAESTEIPENSNEAIGIVEAL